MTKTVRCIDCGDKKTVDVPAGVCVDAEYLLYESGWWQDDYGKWHCPDCEDDYDY